MDKALIELNETVLLAQPGIKDIANLSKNISEQVVEISEQIVKKIKQEQEDAVLKQLSKLLMAILLLKINSKAVNRFRKSKVAKLLGRGLSLLENMV